MEIVKAKTSGFCFGVEKAVETTFNLAESGGKQIYTLGDIIHNKIVIDSLKEKGVKVINSLDELNDSNAIVIIRAHGVPKIIYEQLESRNIDYVDATCPYVKKIQRLAEKYYLDGYQIIITGDSSHPEVIGINGWCNNEAIIIDSVEQLKEIEKKDKKYCLLSQTTYNKNKWYNILSHYKKEFDKSSYFDTICNATTMRQEEASLLASDVDLMLVIGDKKSSNSMKLFDICSEKCTNTMLVESPDDLVGVDFNNIKKTGITAGASTPERVIGEVINIMSENNGNEIFASMLEESLTTLTSGETVKGTIIRVDTSGVFVDLGFKYEGFVSIEEFSEQPEVGDEVEAVVVRVNDKDGEVTLSKRKLDYKKDLKVIEQSYNDKTPITVTVKQVIKGGLAANIGKTRVFIPASHVEDRFVSDLTPYLNKELDIVIITFERGRRGQMKIVGSHKIVAKKKNEKAASEVWSSIEVGKEYTGTVKNLTNFGAFVDIGGVDGLVHISELSWKKIKHPSQVVKVGDEINVHVLSFEQENDKISLGYKKAEDNPWLNIENEYNVGDVVPCKVVRFVPFGVFVQLENGVDGLVHISQISNVRINAASDVLKMGQTVEAKITEIDIENKKINLNIRDVQAYDPEVIEEETVDVNEVVSDSETPEDNVTEEISADEIVPEEVVTEEVNAEEIVSEDPKTEE